MLLPSASETLAAGHFLLVTEGQTLPLAPGPRMGLGLNPNNTSRLLPGARWASPPPCCFREQLSLFWWRQG